MFEIMNVPGIL